MPRAKKKPVLFLVGTRPNDPAQEADFNRWYDQVHFPEILKLGYITKASRYQLEGNQEGYPKYLAGYELPDEEAMKAFSEHGRKQRSGQAPAFTPGPPATRVWWAFYKPV